MACRGLCVWHPWFLGPDKSQVYSQGAFAYGIYMAKFFRSFDSERATLSDYVAVLEGVPSLKGDEMVEDILKEVGLKHPGLIPSIVNYFKQGNNKRSMELHG